MISNNNGFTLIELAFTLCLIVIIAGIAGSGIMMAVPGISLKNAANDLAADMRFARSLAVKNQEIVTISFDTDEGSYRISSPTIDRTVNLSDYRGGIRFGTGMANNKATIDADPFDSPDDVVSFQGDVNYNGSGMNNRTGYVYLCNENNDISYAAGLTSRAGVVTFRKTKDTDSWITL